MAPKFDPSAVALRIFERHARAVRWYLYRLTRDPAIADDLAQDVFLRVVRSASTYEAREREAAWVFRIAQNVLRDFRRQGARSVEHAVPADAATAPDQALGLDIQLALAQLPSDEREALLLGEVAGLTYHEIAEATGATVPAVRSRIYRARQALRARLMPPPALALPMRGHHDD